MFTMNAHKTGENDDPNVYITPAYVIEEREVAGSDGKVRVQPCLVQILTVEDLERSKVRQYFDKDEKKWVSSKGSAGVYVQNGVVKTPDGQIFQVNTKGGRYGQDPLFVRIEPA